MKKLILFTVLLFCSMCFKSKLVQGQYLNAKPEDFTEITNRTLIVQMMHEDNYYIEEVNKKIEKTKNVNRKEELQKDLESYKNFIIDFNKYIKDVVDKYWLYNKKKPVEFKSFSEVEVLRRNDPRSYTILLFHNSKKWVRNEYGKETYANHTIPTLIYSRLENCNPYDPSFYEKIDYSFFFPYINMRKESELLSTDLVLSFRVMQLHIKVILEKNKKDYKVVNFARDQAEENCHEVAKQNFLLEDRLMENKVTKADISKVFTGNINIIPSSEVSAAIEKDEDFLVGMAIPYEIKSDKSGIPGLELAERIMYYKCFVDIKTGEIYSVYGDKTVDNWEPYFNVKEFKKLEKCK